MNQKLKTCKTKATQLLLKPLPQVEYLDKKDYSNYLRVQDFRKSIPLATGVLTGLFLMGWLSCGLGEWYFPAAVYGSAACLSFGGGVGAYLAAYLNELQIKNQLLKETEQEK